MKCIIVIPIYKSLPAWNETISFIQCLKVLHNHPFCIITHEELNISHYTNLLELNKIHYVTKFLNKSYFENISSYNRLLLSKDFYYKLKKYDYILIHQLDAYVFNDELEFWCKQGYDYIGAPWFEDYQSYEENKKLWKVGNGGFSLRKVKTFSRLLSYSGPIYKPAFIFKQTSFQKNKNLFKTSLLFILKCFGYENTLSYLLKKNSINEDGFWALTFHNSWLKIKTPQIDTAQKFAFEKSPGYLFKRNNNKLPFGCHAWEKYDYEVFWKQYIFNETNEEKM